MNTVFVYFYCIVHQKFCRIKRVIKLTTNQLWDQTYIRNKKAVVNYYEKEIHVNNEKVSILMKMAEAQHKKNT